MGNADSKLNFRKAVIELTSKTQVLHLVHCYTHSVSNQLLGLTKHSEYIYILYIYSFFLT